MSESEAPFAATGIVIAAGGTGGHMFPALALAQELSRRGRRVDLMTDRRGEQFDAQFPATNIYRIPSASISLGKPHLIVPGIFQLISGAMAARRLLAQAEPATVIGFGGYPSLPPVIAAILAGIPTCIHEQNAVVGRANRLLARFVDAIGLSFGETARLAPNVRAKTEITGNPVRDGVIKLEGSPYPDCEPKKPFVLLIFGGSQGARLFSDVVPEAIANLPQATKAGLEVVQQAREEDLERVRAAYAAGDVKAEVAPFFRDLPERMAKAALVVSRSGASSVAELSVIGRPAVLVPLPHALDKDQLLNAQAFTKAGGGWVVEEAEFTPDRLGALLTRLRFSPDELKAAAASAALFGHGDAVKRLADLVERTARAQPDSEGAGTLAKRAVLGLIGLVVRAGDLVSTIIRNRGVKK